MDMSAARIKRDAGCFIQIPYTSFMALTVSRNCAAPARAAVTVWAFKLPSQYNSRLRNAQPPPPPIRGWAGSRSVVWYSVVFDVCGYDQGAAGHCLPCVILLILMFCVHTANEGPARIKYKWWFPFMYSQKWNCYFQNRIIRSCLLVPTLNICERFIFFQDRSAYSAAGKYVDRFWKYINECGNWDCGRAVPWKGIH